jgi:SAP domain-containing ribonucleoprotein
MSSDWKKAGGVKEPSARIDDVQKDDAHVLEDGEHVSGEDMGKEVDDSGAVGTKTAVGEENATDALASVAAPAAMTDIEKKRKRAERFGTDLRMTEADKRKLRAARFSGGSKNGAVAGEAGVEVEKTGTVKAPSKALLEAENAKRKARAERFGGPPEEVTVKPKSPQSVVAAKPKLAQDEEAKKKARMARFAVAAK